MAVYAVGDIQGCYKSLRALLKKVDFNADKDVLWCVGDLVNRGPDSLKVLRYLKGLGDACVCVLGNHDLHLLECINGGRNYSRDTFDKILTADDKYELLDWLRHRPLMHVDKDLGWCMVHAGLHPSWSLEEAKRRAEDVESVLRGDGWKAFCTHLHHAEFPEEERQRTLLERMLFTTLGRSFERMLFTTAVLTRTRYCTDDGIFNWDIRSGEAEGVGEQAWFNHEELAWRGDIRVAYGHWAAKGLVLDQAHVMGLDSGCVWGNELSLARLDMDNPVVTTVQSRE